MKRHLLLLLSTILLSCALNSHAQILVSTYAGTANTGGYSGDGGLAIIALLSSPSDVTVDKNGNLYIADFINNVIRKVDTFGTITTFAGTGTGAGGTATGGYSGDNGPATAADMNGPFALAIDKNGNMIIADGYNHVVRKINPSGTITTIAGNHTAGYSGDGGPATSAQLNNPVGIAVDTTGNIYVADDHNNVIRKINTSGIISTFAGDSTAGYTGNGGPATVARLNLPIGVAVDKIGNVYIADAQNNVVRKVDNAGIITTYAGATDTAHGYSGDEGAATNARLYYPTRLYCDSANNLYISDALNSVIRLVTPAGIISTYAGSISGFYGDGLPKDSAQFLVTYGLTMNKHGHVFIADRGNQVIRRIGPPIASQVNNIDERMIGLSLYPNPVNNGSFTIALSSFISEQAVIEIHDVMGATVKRFNISTNQPATVNTKLPPGVYFISATTTQSKLKSKCLKLLVID